MPEPSAPQDLAYAVHTATCSYLLDEDGVCRWIVSPQGLAPPHVKQAVGAQFVACLDLDEPGGLVGDLRVGGMALFAHHDGARMTLLRTAPITNVDDRRGKNDEDTTVREFRPRALSVSKPVELRQYGMPVGQVPYRASPPPQLSVVEAFGGEQTITLTLPFSQTRPRAK